MAPISYFNKVRVITLIETGLSEAAVADQLGMAKSSVNLIVRRWRERGFLQRQLGSGRPRASTAVDDIMLVHNIEHNPFLKAREAIMNANFPASVFTARRRIQEANLKNYAAARKIRLTDRHKEARLGFALQHLPHDNNFWEHVIFSDEKTFQSSSSGNVRVYRPRNRRYHTKYTQKIETNRRFSVNIWAWISANSPGVLLHLEERFTSDVYITVLEDMMLPSVTQVFPEGDFVFQQDNCPVHTAHRVTEWFRNHNINVLEWPSLSPDLNPIEHMWGILVKSIQNQRTLFQNRDEFLAAIRTAWNALPQGYFRNLCLSMSKRLNKVIEVNGEMTKY